MMNVNSSSPFNQSLNSASEHAPQQKKIFKDKVTDPALLAAIEEDKKAEERAIERLKELAKLSPEEREMENLRIRDAYCRSMDLKPLTPEEKERLRAGSPK